MNRHGWMAATQIIITFLLISMLSPKDFYTTGMSYIKRKPILNGENERRFRSTFGTTPNIIYLIWQNIEPSLASESRYFHLLWALMFLKLYNNENVSAGMVGGVSEKTFRRHVWTVLAAIDKIKKDVIILDNRFKDQNGSQCLLSVDGTDFKINEPHPFSRLWYSHKFNHAALRYEVAICIQTGEIVWIKGPFAAGAWPDIKIFRGWLKNHLLPGERVEADSGYQGDGKIDGPDDYASCMGKYMEKFIVRARHETVNSRFKQFNALQQTFRHSRHKHAHVFNSIAVITQLAIQYGEPLFDVTYSTEK